MNIKQTIITAAVALTMVAMIAPLSASATTAMSGNIPTVCVGVSFTRNLRVGFTGHDVQCFQALLNTHGYVLAASGAGSPGLETMYFGPRTLASVRAWQAAQGWTPANQVGPLSRAMFNSWLTGSSSTTTTPPTVTPMGAGLTVMLASNTPASGTVVRTQGLAKLASFTFVNGDNAPVNVTGLSVARIGVSADTSLQNVYLFNGATRLTDAASVSSGNVNFNGGSVPLFTVPSQGSVTITVAADLNANSGETLGAAIMSMASVTTNASSVHGTFPVMGNLMTVASATLAGVQFASTTTPSTNTSLNPQNGYVVWQNSTVVSTRAVNLTRIAFRLIGSVNYTALQNFVLNIDGVNIGSPVMNLDSNGYVTFDLSSSPVTLQTGTRVIKLMADIVGGSSRNFYFSIRVAADANFVDSQYGVNVSPTTATNNGSFTLSDVTAGTQTVASGTMTIIKSTTSPSGNITNNASNAVLADWLLTSAGESVKVMNLNILAGFTNNDTACTTSTAAATLRNGALYANGVQVGSTTSVSNTGSGSQFNFGSSLIVNPLTPVTLEFRADVYDNGNATNCITSGDTLAPSIVSVSSNAQGMVSLSTLTVPSSNVSANTLTVAVGALTLSKYTAYTNQTVVAPVTNYKLADFTLTNGTVEPINLNTIYADLDSNFATYVTNLYVKYGTQQTTPISNPSATSLANSWSINSQLALGQTIDISVYGNVNASIGAVTSHTLLKVLGTTANSGQSVSVGSPLQGQALTFGSGTINAVVDGTTPQNQSVSGNQEVVAGRFKITATNDSYTITEMRFKAQDTTPTVDGAIISSVNLKDGSTVIGSGPFDSTNNVFYLTGLNEAIPANTNKVLTLDYVLATPYQTQPTSAVTTTTGLNPIATLSYIKTINSNGVMHDAGAVPGGSLLSSNSAVTIAASTTGSSAGNYVYVYKTIPTFTVGSVSGQGTLLTAGSTVNLYNFTVSADAKGPVSLRQLNFTVNVNDNTSTNSVTAQLKNFKFFRGSTDLTQTGEVAIKSGSTDLTATNTLTGAGNTVTVIFYNPEEVIPAGSSYTYTLKATAQNFAALGSSGNDSVSTVLSGDTAPGGGVSAGVNATGYYLGSSGHSASAVQVLNTSDNQTSSSGGTANVIWSDNSAQVHDYSDSATTSGDWFNGYLINNLPLDTIGFSAQ